MNRGATVCGNARLAALPIVDEAVRELLATEVLRPTVLERALDRAVALLTDAQDQSRQRTRRLELRKRLDRVNQAVANLTETAARGGAVPAVLDALTRTDAEHRALMAELEALDASPRQVFDARALRRTLRGYVNEWQALASGHVSPAACRSSRLTGFGAPSLTVDAENVLTITHVLFAAVTGTTTSPSRLSIADCRSTALTRAAFIACDATAASLASIGSTAAFVRK